MISPDELKRIRYDANEVCFFNSFLAISLLDEIERLHLELSHEKRQVEAKNEMLNKYIEKYLDEAACSNQASRNRDEWKARAEKVLAYCASHIDQMWAASVVSILLDCDFRDSKAAIAEYRESLGEK